MVMITPEEVMAQRRREQIGGDVLNQFQRELLRNSCRLDVPMDNSHRLRKIAPIIAGLAEHIAFTSRRTDISEYDILRSIQGAFWTASREIRSLHGNSLPNGTYRKK